MDNLLFQDTQNKLTSVTLKLELSFELILLGFNIKVFLKVFL